MAGFRVHEAVHWLAVHDEPDPHAGPHGDVCAGALAFLLGTPLFVVFCGQMGGAVSAGTGRRAGRGSGHVQCIHMNTEGEEDTQNGWSTTLIPCRYCCVEPTTSGQAGASFYLHTHFTHTPHTSSTGMYACTHEKISNYQIIKLSRNDLM